MTFAQIAPAPGRSPLAANIACVGSMLVWAAGFPMADALLDHLPSVAVTTLRLAFATAFLLPIWYLADGGQEMRAAPWRSGLLVGAVGLGLGALCLVYGQSWTDGITTAVITATMPIVGIGLEWLFDGRRLGWRVLLGIVLSVGGGIAVYGARMGHLDFGAGAAAILASTFVFAWGSRASVTRIPAMSALGRTTITMTGGAVLALAVQALLPLAGGPGIPWAAITPRDWAYLAFYGIGSMAISQLLFLTGVAGLGIGVATMHINVAPLYVMLIALAFGDSWSWILLAASILVMIGVLIAQSRPPRP